jgi:branched-subunit amino acid transport protein
VIWAAVVVTAAGCYLLKLLGLSVPERVLEHPVVSRVADLIPVALLAALVAVQVLADGSRLTVDARLAALAVAAVALVFRAPFLIVVVLGAATAALLRLA